MEWNILCEIGFSVFAFPFGVRGHICAAIFPVANHSSRDIVATSMVSIYIEPNYFLAIGPLLLSSQAQRTRQPTARTHTNTRIFIYHLFSDFPNSLPPNMRSRCVCVFVYVFCGSPNQPVNPFILRFAIAQKYIAYWVVHWRRTRIPLCSQYICIRTHH